MNALTPGVVVLVRHASAPFLGSRLKRRDPSLHRPGRVLRYVLQTFREEDPIGFHDPARSVFNFFHL